MSWLRQKRDETEDAALALPNAPLMRSLSRADAPSVGAEIVYAIGDIHGRLDLFNQLVRLIVEDFQFSAAPPPARPTLITLGDYVDRGADSKGVIDKLIEIDESRAFDFHPLMGNHEEAFITFINDPRFGPIWLRYGGAATLRSYGVTPPEEDTPMAWREAHLALREALPPAHIAFLNSLPSKAVIKDYVFVHAGVRPGIPLMLQRGADMRWIREPFLSHQGSFGRTIVHGHTPVDQPYLSDSRINCDTRAYASGVLTALRLNYTQRTLIQVKGEQFELSEDEEPASPSAVGQQRPR